MQINGPPHQLSCHLLLLLIIPLPSRQGAGAGLVEAFGFDGIDAGALADSWRQHPGTPAYCRDLVTDGLKAALAQADAGQIARYRAEADEAVRPYFAVHR